MARIRPDRPRLGSGLLAAALACGAFAVAGPAVARADCTSDRGVTSAGCAGASGYVPGSHPGGSGPLPGGTTSQSGYVPTGPPQLAGQDGAYCPNFGSFYKIPPQLARGNDIPPSQMTGYTMTVYPNYTGNTNGSVTATYPDITFQIAATPYNGFNPSGPSPTYTIHVDPLTVPTVDQQNVAYAQQANQFAAQYNSYSASQLVTATIANIFSGLFGGGSVVNTSNISFINAADVQQHVGTPQVGGPAYADELKTFGMTATITINPGRMVPPSSPKTTTTTTPVLNAQGQPVLNANGQPKTTTTTTQIGWNDSWTCVGFSASVTLDMPTLVKPQPATPSCLPNCYGAWQQFTTNLFQQWAPGTLETMPAAGGRTYVNVPTYFWIANSQRPNANSPFAMGQWQPVTSGGTTVWVYSAVSIDAGAATWYFGDGTSATAGRAEGGPTSTPAFEPVTQQWSQPSCSGNYGCVIHQYRKVSPSVCAYLKQDFTITYFGYYNAGGGLGDVNLPTVSVTRSVYWPSNPPNYDTPGCSNLAVDQIQGVPVFPSSSSG